MTVGILLSEPYNTLNDGSVASNTIGLFNFSARFRMSGVNESISTSQQNNRSLNTKEGIIVASLTVLFARQVINLIIFRGIYVRSLQNYLQILMVIITPVACFGGVESDEWKHPISAVALFVGWAVLLPVLGRLPLLSVQYKVLITVSWTFLRFVAGYVTLLIGFALSFYIIFKGSSEQGGAEMFANIPVSILKKIVMFTGEFEASSLSFDTLPFTSHVIFLLFVVVVAIVSLNLLNGLAVNDTGEIRRRAETLSLAARTTLISEIDRTVTCSFFRTERKNNCNISKPAE